MNDFRTLVRILYWLAHDPEDQPTEAQLDAFEPEVRRFLEEHEDRVRYEHVRRMFVGMARARKASKTPN